MQSYQVNRDACLKGAPHFASWLKKVKAEKASEYIGIEPAEDIADTAVQMCGSEKMKLLNEPPFAGAIEEAHHHSDISLQSNARGEALMEVLRLLHPGANFGIEPGSSWAAKGWRWPVARSSA